MYDDRVTVRPFLALTLPRQPISPHANRPFADFLYAHEQTSSHLALPQIRLGCQLGEEVMRIHGYRLRDHPTIALRILIWCRVRGGVRSRSRYIPCRMSSRDLEVRLFALGAKARIQAPDSSDLSDVARFIIDIHQQVL